MFILFVPIVVVQCISEHGRVPAVESVLACLAAAAAAAAATAGKVPVLSSLVTSGPACLISTLLCTRHSSSRK